MKLVQLSLSFCAWWIGSEAAFTFVLQINNHTTSGDCDTAINPGCETFFSPFCLRESRTNTSTNTSDCPLGDYDGKFDQEKGDITIQSNTGWMEGFQLFIQAFDSDTLSSDDHLDNIFIEGSLQDDMLSSPMTYTGVKKRVSITVQFQRLCSTNYYGLSCLSYCEATDNLDGHFTCNTDGSKICLAGYDDPDNNCTNNINDCASEPCHNGGICMDMVADFSCVCSPGYTGKHCSVDIDECQDVYCPGNSSCMDSVDAYTCVCNPGYTGDNCTEILNPCAADPCGSGGTCIRLDPVNSMCKCLAGYSGPQCEKSGSKLSVRVIGSVVGVAVLLLLGCLILCLLLLILGTRQRYKKLNNKTSRRNEYIPSPSKSDYMEYNTLYVRTENSGSSGLQSPNGSLHICENSLYSLPENSFIEECGEEKTNFMNSSVVNEEQLSNGAITTSPKRSYENLTTAAKETNNPLYGESLTTPTQETAKQPPSLSMSPPVYSVPEPIPNSPLHSSASNNNSPKSHAYEVVASTDEDTNKAEEYCGSTDGKGSHKEPLLPVLSQNMKTKTSSQDRGSSYDQLHHNITNHVLQQQSVQLSDHTTGYGKLQHN